MSAINHVSLSRLPRFIGLITALLAPLQTARSEEFVGDVTRFSPSVGQPLFPVGNINVFKQFAFDFGEKLEVGKKVDVGFGTFGAEASGEVAAAMGFEFGVCIGGNSDYDLGFKPRISVPDKIPYEFPLTLHVEEGLMPDSKFTTNFPPLGKAYADLIFDITIEAQFEACVFGCITFTLFSLRTADLAGMTYMNIPLGAIVPSAIANLFATSVRCDSTVKDKAFTSIELASWNRNEDNKFKLLNVFGTRKDAGDRTPDRLANFLAEPVLEYGGSLEVGGAGTTFTADPATDEITTTGSLSFVKGGGVVFIGSNLPGGLAEKKVYYALAAGKTFKVARRLGGSALDIKDAGGGGSIRKNDPEKPGSPKGDAGAWGKISITAPTVSTDSSVSEVDDLVRNFAVLSGNRIQMEPKVDLESGLRGFHDGIKVRVQKDGSNSLPNGLNPACVYYVINADPTGLQYQLATKVGGVPVEIAVSALTNKIARSAEFNSVDGLSSTGAEDVAAVTIDVVGLVNEIAFKASPLKVQAEYDLGIASIDYKLISLEVGPAIQLQTDYKMSWDLVVDDIEFRQAGTMAEAEVRFVEKVNENAAKTDFSSLTKAFPGRVFHMTSLGPHAIPEISLLNGNPVGVTILYHLEPKLKTKVSAPIFGRVKYEALEVGAEIKQVGGLRLGPLIEGEHKFKLGEFTVYDGDPFPLDKGKVEPRTDFDQSEDRDRYELILVDETSGEITPSTGCAEVIVIKRADGLHLKIFDVEGEVIAKRSKPVSEILSPATALALANELTPWPTPDLDKKVAILKSATRQANLQPGVMSFALQADGPADYHWQPFIPYDANSESDFSQNSATSLSDDRIFYNTEIDGATGATKGYADNGPSGVWQYGYITSGDRSTFTPFQNSSWVTPGESFYDTGFFLEDGVFMDPSVSIAKSNGTKWPVRRWVSPGGRVDITWGVAMRPGSIALSNTGGQDLTPVPSNGLSGELYVDGVRKDIQAVSSAASFIQGNSDLRFELDIEGYGNEPLFTVRNTGGVAIRQFYLTIGDTGFNFDSVLFNGFAPTANNGGDVILADPDSDDDGGRRTDNITINFASLPPGGEVKFIADFDPDNRNGDADYETILFNNGGQPNAFATVTGVNNAQTSIRLLDSPNEPSYRFRSTSIPASRVTMQMRTLKDVELKKGQVIDLILNPNNDAWQDVAVMTMDIKVQGYEWASPPDSPTNWAEFLSGNGAHQPNAYPGSLFTTGTATNWATIDKIDTAPYPSLTSLETIGTLQVKDSARLHVVPPDGQTASLTVHDGAVANSGTVDVFQANGGTGSMILGGPAVSDTSLTGKGTVKLRGSSLMGWRDPNAASGPVSFLNYNTIQGSGVAMDFLTTHPAAESSITNMGTYQAESGFLATSAQNFVNRFGLFSQSAGTLSVRGEQFENRYGAFVGAGGANAIVRLTFNEGINTGYIYANDQGYVQVLPGQSTHNIWSAGLEDSSEQQGTFLVDDAYMELDSINVTGGAFVARNGGLLRTQSNRGDVFFTGSNMDIGNFDPETIDPNSGSLSLSPGKIIFTGVAMRNFGQMAVNAGATADFIDSRLFENHGKITVQHQGSLRFREIKDKTVDPNASDVARRSPGLANATGETLLGGTWDIAGELLMDGATITKIAADVQSDTSYGNSYEDDAGVKVGDSVIVDSNASTAEACALSLCQPAHVIMRGLTASFPALDFLQTNCGTLHLLDGAGLDGTLIPSGGEGQRPNGDFVNRGGMLINDGPLKVAGRFTQMGPDAQMTITGTGAVTSATNEYFIMGGDVSVGPEAQFMNLNASRDGFLPGTKIVVNSPFVRVVRSNAEITPASVNFGAETTISSIDQGVDVTLHGAKAGFPTRNLVSNAGSLTISGDHGLDNHGSADIGYGGDFTNTGKLSILGRSSFVFMYDDFAQTGSEALTQIAPGARLRLNRGMQVTGGQVVLDIAARPHHPSFYASISGSNNVNFGNRLVINFTGDFLKVRPDIGDTWEIMPRSSSASVSGVETVTYLRDGVPMPDDFLPPNSHLEVVHLPTSNPNPRGLALRVAPDDGWILFDDWLKDVVGNASFVGDYAAYTDDYFYGSNNIGGTSPAQGQLRPSLVQLDGEEFYQVSYTRRSLVDASFATYGSVDLKSWYPAPMAVLDIVPANDGSGLETVTLRSTFPLVDDQLFLQVRGTLNLDNAAEGIVPEKPINVYWGSSLRNLERYLIDEVFHIPLERRNGGAFHPDDVEAAAQQLPYRIVPGRVLYFRIRGGDNDNSNAVVGGTADDGVTRDFIYMDKSIVGYMMIHAGLVDRQSYGLAKVTILERQPTFLGSTQKSPDGRTTIISRGKTNEAAETDEVFSYKVEGYVDPFDN